MADTLTDTIDKWIVKDNGNSLFNIYLIFKNVDSFDD